MSTFLSIGVETLAVAALVIGFQFAAMAFRNPFRPAWLGRSGLDTLTATAFVTALPFAVGLQVIGLMESGTNFMTAAGIVAALFAVIALGSATILRTGERLRLADSGHSPFRRLKPTLPGDAPPAAPAA